MTWRSARTPAFTASPAGTRRQPVDNFADALSVAVTRGLQRLRVIGTGVVLDSGLDFRGLLLAAVIIGTLGVLDDVTITQVSAVWELRRSNRGMGARQLYGSGIRIGRDHIASTVNTLVLAYSAAALPLLLIYSQSGLAFGEVLTTETVAVASISGAVSEPASIPVARSSSDPRARVPTPAPPATGAAARRRPSPTPTWWRGGSLATASSLG